MRSGLLGMPGSEVVPESASGVFTRARGDQLGRAVLHDLVEHRDIFAADFRGRDKNQSSYNCPDQRKANTSRRPPSHGTAIGSRSNAASRRIGLWLRRSKVTVIRPPWISTVPPVSTKRR